MIYVFLANGFEEIEAITVIDILRRAELDVITVGVGGEVIRGAHGVDIVSDITDNDINLSRDLEMIILPGGMPGTLNLDKNPNVHKAIDYAVKNSIRIAAICAAPSILGRKGLLKGKKATCYPGFENQLFDADIAAESVCVDGDIVTANAAGAAIAFSLELVKILLSKERAQKLSASILYE